MKTKQLSLYLILLLGGCSSTHIVYVQETSMGLNVAVSADGMQKMSLGYDRDVYAIIPKKDKEGDAMALFSVNKVNISGLDNMDVSEFVATGYPAIKLATDQDAVSKIRSKIYGK
ncbi:MAG: hypothetical protein HRT38_00270 [Alteromonadaceae bacterium]|nr:hypothetical protein [Alteromonadaceae bacterium]